MNPKAKIALGTLGGLLLLAAAAPVAAYLQPGLVGTDEAFIVLTGSMRPAIDPGDVVFVAQTPIEEVEVGDVVNFHPHATAQQTYTHRVVDITHDQRGTILTTKGDANEDPDPMQVNDEMLVGTVEHRVPAMGKLIVFAQGPITLITLVGLSVLTIGHELRHILRPEDEPQATPDPTTTGGQRFEVVQQR